MPNLPAKFMINHYSVYSSFGLFLMTKREASYITRSSKTKSSVLGNEWRHSLLDVRIIVPSQSAGAIRRQTHLSVSLSDLINSRSGCSRGGQPASNPAPAPAADIRRRSAHQCCVRSLRRVHARHASGRHLPMVPGCKAKMQRCP